jgi:hypothetical protein
MYFCGGIMHDDGLSGILLCPQLATARNPLHDVYLWKKDPTKYVCVAGLQGGLVVNNTGNYYPALRIAGMTAGQAVSLDDIEVSSRQGLTLIAPARAMLLHSCLMLRCVVPGCSWVPGAVTASP